MPDDRDQALALMGSVGHAAGWLNKLDKLFAVVRDHAVALAQRSPGYTADHLLAAIDAFRLEFYGADDGSDHPDAADVSEDPADPVDVEAKVRALFDVSIGHIPRHNVAAIVIAYNDDAIKGDVEILQRIGQQLAATYPHPQPLVILNPMGGVTDFGFLDEDAMAKAGWVRKNDDA